MQVARREIIVKTKSIRTSHKTNKRLTISGKHVSCSTLVTETPPFSKEVAVPPVETIVNLQKIKHCHDQVTQKVSTKDQIPGNSSLANKQTLLKNDVDSVNTAKNFPNNYRNNDDPIFSLSFH